MYPIRFLIERTKKENYIKDIFYYAYNIHEKEKYLEISIDGLTTFGEKYLLIFFLTKKAFLKIDPAGISRVSWNEYDIEIISIAYKLCWEKWEFNSIKKVVFEVLEEYLAESLHYKSDTKITEIIFNEFEKYKDNFSFHKEIEKLSDDYINSKF